MDWLQKQRKIIYIPQPTLTWKTYCWQICQIDSILEYSLYTGIQLAPYYGVFVDRLFLYATS